jgi:hypothetical protein
MQRHTDLIDLNIALVCAGLFILADHQCQDALFNPAH